ncbi:MBL fold metallo-hydrolase [Candidatus Woesearchaeota archaeon]|nr:MBL fold metallo-hydrolase [Candidatus Woesearchaeota archaeon]
MKLIFHGAAREVGRSCIEIQTQGDRYLLDAGIKFKEGGFEYPEKVINVPDIDGLIISHAHLDHSGALPLFEHYNIICPVFCTRLTYELTKILLKDSYKIERIRNLHPAYGKVDLKKVDKSMRLVKYDTEYNHRKMKFMLRNAGHVPGSSMILLEAEGKKILYTGDIKLKTTEVVKGAFTDYSDIDVLIIESTYGNRDLPDRQETRKRFLDKVEETVKKGGSALIPVFSLGRAQDVLVMLHEKKFNVPIYMDGMCKKITNKLIGSNDPYVNNKEILEEMYDKRVERIGSERHRKRAMQRQGIFVVTSGMLQGGPVLAYLKYMWHESKNAILLTGYQCKRTNGRHLLEEGFIYIDGWRTEVKCFVDKFDFSGHADKNDLMEIIRRVNPKKIIFQHGDEEAVDEMKKWAEQQGKWIVYAPAIGDEIEI